MDIVEHRLCPLSVQFGAGVAETPSPSLASDDQVHTGVFGFLPDSYESYLDTARIASVRDFFSIL